jgi:hypothetical protein
MDSASQTSNRAILAACAAALAPARCERAAAGEPVRARVRWKTELVAQVDTWDGRVWRTQALVFSEQDSTTERSRSVGLLLAALANESQSPRAESSSRDRERPLRSASNALALDASAAVVAGTGAAEGHWRSGLQVALGARIVPWPLGLRFSASGSMAGAADPNLSVTWLAPALGPYVLHEPSPAIRFSAGIDLAWEWWIASLHDTTTIRSQRSYASLRPWASVSVWPLQWLGVQAGCLLSTTPGQTVRIDGRSAGRNPALGVLALTGLELRSFD